jgi:hypothetical protein
MRFKGMRGYKRAPAYNELKGGLRLVNVFELVNRVAISARQFLRLLQ